ncbi:MAG TPA: deoxyguanosinetriphosphate triphosphohydrolase [Rhodospirillaceae bacterium]|nr:MAG: hypothetical protein A2018_03115 [Alphaproteobacteria bacterium GWF2_58_20]HAU29364.1 deoxyguanosinetriphosphate triphosphohydrolase [Rhodospirillaceae bacterium]
MLKPYACIPEESRGRFHFEKDDDGRTCFARDRDRIIHSGAFRKMQFRCQVLLSMEGDYYRTRLTHSIEVGQIARALARHLGLNEDLSEAIGLAHDLGHAPFGHMGGEVLDECMVSYGGFDHNDHALRVVGVLEKRYAGFDGLNLSWEVIEGLAKHNGPLLPLEGDAVLPPATAAIDAAWPLELDKFASAEAQASAISDDIAYNTHDIDDGLQAGFFDVSELGEISFVAPVLEGICTQHPGLEEVRLRHELIRRLISMLVSDVVEESHARILALNPVGVDDIRLAGHPVIAFSEGMRAHVNELRRFLYERMYRNRHVNRIRPKIQQVVSDLFSLYMENPDCLAPEAVALKGNQRARFIADALAGMTDRSILEDYDQMFHSYPYPKV